MMRASVAWALSVGSVVCGLGLVPAAHADGLLSPWPASDAAPAAPWHVAGLPHQSKPYTRFTFVDVDGHHALRVEADRSYGNLVHALQPGVPARGLHLDWQWRVDEPIAQADLRARSGDDTALKVCVFFDLPLERVPFLERQLLRAARASSNEPLPAATVCYVWDTQLPIGTALDNAYTHRMRYIVLESGAEHLHQWTHERRDVAADFMRLFGTESTEVSPVIGVAIGADADNTRGHSVGWVADVTLSP